MFMLTVHDDCGFEDKQLIIQKMFKSYIEYSIRPAHISK